MWKTNFERKEGKDIIPASAEFWMWYIVVGLVQNSSISCLWFDPHWQNVIWGPKTVGEENAADQAFRAPGVEKNVSPPEKPNICPDSAKETIYTRARNFFPRVFEEDADSHKHEKSSYFEEFSSSTHAPQTDSVENARDEESTEDTADAAHEKSESVSSKRNKYVPKELMPSPWPKLRKWGRKPRVIE